MKARPRTKFVMQLQTRRCPKCNCALNNQRTRCKKCHRKLGRPKK